MKLNTEQPKNNATHLLILLGAILVGLTLGLLWFSPAGAANSDLDVNLDGTINVTDALCVVRTIGRYGPTPACPPITKLRSDVNHDGITNQTDVDCVLGFLSGYPATPQCPFNP